MKINQIIFFSFFIGTIALENAEAVTHVNQCPPFLTEAQLRAGGVGTFRTLAHEGTTYGHNVIYPLNLASSLVDKGRLACKYPALTPNNQVAFTVYLAD